MKKILSIILTAALLLSVAFCFGACSNEGEKGDATKGNTTDASATDASTTDANGNDTTGSTEEPKILKMATNAYFKPYEFYDGETIVGIDAEIAKAIGDKLGYTVVIEDMEFDSILTAVKEGSVDFGMAGMTVNEDRLKEVDFTVSYANGVQSIIVKEGSPITSCDDLYAEGAAYKVGVQSGTTGDTYSTDDFGADRVTAYLNGNEAVLALLGGSVDCVIIDNQPALALVEANEGLKILDTEYANEDYAICVKKGNSELLDKLNAAIDALIEDGTVDAIISKYIK